jgi:hypothetical protein
MQLPTLSSVTSHLIPVSALIVALSGVYITVKTLTEKRNADLVQIGVSVLRVDPDKEKQISATREWALNLIDANAGGVKFSQEARAQLLREPLKYGGGYDPYVGGYDPGDKPLPPRPGRNRQNSHS